MTTEEALKELQNNLQVAIQDQDGLNPEYERQQIDSLQIALEALEKQIPKKPIKTNYIVKVHGVHTLLDENEFTKCPSCTYKDIEVKRGQKYCHICGQALDWSDTK